MLFLLSDKPSDMQQAVADLDSLVWRGVETFTGETRQHKFNDLYKLNSNSSSSVVLALKNEVACGKAPFWGLY